MKISEFIKGRRVERQALTRYINRHSELFAGHIVKNGKEIELDDVAVEILNNKYPLQQLVQIVEDTESIKKLAAANEKIAKLQEVIGQQKELLLKADNQIQLLEYKKDEFEHYKQESNEKIVNLSTDLTEKNSEIEQLKAELEAEKTRKLTLKERLFGKKG